MDGNAVSFSAPQLGSGAVVNIGTGASLEFADESSDNKWDLTKTLTGTGTVKNFTHDGLIIHRNAADTIGGISPGTGDGAAGILSFDMGTNNATPFTFSTLDFAKDGTGGVQWHIDVVGTGGVAGTDYDQIRLAPSSGGNPNAWLRGLDKVNLVVDVGAISGDPGTITIFTGADNNLSAMTFGTQTWLNNYFGDVIYGVDGTIKLTNIVAPVLWEAASGDWSEGAKWSPDGAPGVTTLTSVNNGGTSTITGNESTKTLFVQYANSAVNIQSGGSLNVALNMEVQAGASATIAGGLTTPILSTSGTTTFNSGATGAITNLNVGGGTTTFNAWGGTVTNMTVSGGALSVADGVAFATSSTAVSGGTVDFGTGSSSSLGTLNVFSGAITSDRALSISTLTMTGGSLTLNNGVSIAATSTARNANIAITGSPSTMGSLTVGKTTNNVAASLTIQDTSVTATTIDIRTDGFQGSAVLNTAPTLGIDNSTVNVGTLRIGANQAYDVRGSITDSTVNVSTNLFTQGSGGGGGTAVLTVGAGGVLNLLTNSSAWSHSTANGYLNLVSGGQFNVTGTVDFTQVRSGTNNGIAWNGGIVRVGTQLTNFNNQQLDPGNILDMSTTGTFGGTVGVDRLYLRGGTIKFGAGYARDARLQMTEDLGLIEVAGGALTNMPNTVSASVSLDGAAATWTTGNKTFGEGTTLTLKNGAATTTGIGNVLNVDQLTFEGTGGTVNMNNAILVHGSNQLSLRNNGLVSGSGSILVGTDGLSLGDNGNEGVLNGTGAGLTVYGDISGWGALGGVTLYGNFSPGSSPGHTTVLAGGLTLTPGVSTYEIGGTNQAVPEYDYTTLNGILTIDPGVTLSVIWIDDFVMGYEASAGDVFELFDIQGGGFSGTFSTISLPTFTNPNLSWDTSDLYTTGEISVFDNNDVEVVPEPSTFALAMLGLAALGWLGWRRRR